MFKKTIFSFWVYLLTTKATYAQHPGPRSFEVIGLPDSKEIMETLPAGIGFLILGIILIAIVISHKKDDGSPSDDPVDNIKFT